METAITLALGAIIFICLALLVGEILFRHELAAVQKERLQKLSRRARCGKSAR